MVRRIKQVTVNYLLLPLFTRNLRSNYCNITSGDFCAEGKLWDFKSGVGQSGLSQVGPIPMHFRQLCILPGDSPFYFNTTSKLNTFKRSLGLLSLQWLLLPTTRKRESIWQRFCCHKFSPLEKFFFLWAVYFFNQGAKTSKGCQGMGWKIFGKNSN